MKSVFLKLFYALLVQPWLRFIIGVRYENKVVMRGLEQYILVANHNSHFDAVALMSGLSRKKLANTHMVAAEDYWGQTGLSRFLMGFFLNSVLIRRKKDGSSISPIEVMDQLLKEGKSLIMFPEGTRGQPGTIADFKKGIAILLQKNPNIPFVPVYLNGFGRVLPKGKSLIIPMICKVRFGTPVIPASHEIEPLLEVVKEAILSLIKEDERDGNLFQFG